jgi:CelD/BcsL family acetyltransferase involved in cellulose biosynthesis
MSSLSGIGASHSPDVFAEPRKAPDGTRFAADPGIMLRWERASIAAEPLSFFQTAPWAGLLGAYDRICGRRPVLLSSPKSEDPGFDLPLSIAREGGIRVARIIGEPLSEYSGTVGSSVTAAGLRAGLSALRRDHGVDLVVLRRVPSESALAEALNELGATVAFASGSPIFHLGPQGLLPNDKGGLAPAYRDACRRRRRLHQKHEYRFVAFPAGREAEEFARVAIAWKKEWVRERGLLSRLGGDPAVGETIARLYRSRETGAAIGVLFLEGQPVAAEGGFRCRDRFFAYTSAYRPDRRADGVGKVAIAEMVEWCAGNGVVTYDKGAPADPYKLEWTDRLVPVADRIIPLTALGWALGEVVETRLKPFVKQKLDALSAPTRVRLLRLTRYSPAARAEA